VIDTSVTILLHKLLKKISYSAANKYFTMWHPQICTSAFCTPLFTSRRHQHSCFRQFSVSAKERFLV